MDLRIFGERIPGGENFSMNAGVSGSQFFDYGEALILPIINGKQNLVERVIELIKGLEVGLQAVIHSLDRLEQADERIILGWRRRSG